MSDAAERFRDPSHLIDELGIRAPEEIDVEAIAEFCGATVVYDRLHGCEASIIGRGDRAIITVNRQATRGRQRFSAAHELCHWLLDRGQAGFACTEEMMEVEWWDEEGEELWIAPEHRANEWATELLLPDLLVSRSQTSSEVSLAAARDLADRFRTSLTPAAMRLVTHTTLQPALLLSIRPGQPPRCLKRSLEVELDLSLRREPGPGTVAYELLRGSASKPGPVEVVSDGWIDRQDAWWFTLHEDSTRMPGGEVLTLLSWTGSAQNELAGMPSLEPLEPRPGKRALRRLEECLCEHWGYRQVRGGGGGTTLVTDDPSPQRIEFPDLRSLDAETIRGLVDEVARHKGEYRDTILDTLVPFPER